MDEPTRVLRGVPQVDDVVASGCLMKFRSWLYPFACDPLKRFGNPVVITGKPHERHKLRDPDFVIRAQVGGGHLIPHTAK